MKTKKLYRSNSDRIIAGVCGGLARYFEIDPTIIRLAFVVLTLINGTGIVIYLILAIITPAENDNAINPRANFNDLTTSIKHKVKTVAEDLRHKEYVELEPGQRQSKTRLAAGILLCFIGLIMVANNYLPSVFFQFWSRMAWPIAIIILGVYLIRKK